LPTLQIQVHRRRDLHKVQDLPQASKHAGPHLRAGSRSNCVTSTGGSAAERSTHTAAQDKERRTRQMTLKMLPAQGNPSVTAGPYQGRPQLAAGGKRLTTSSGGTSGAGAVTSTHCHKHTALLHTLPSSPYTPLDTGTGANKHMASGALQLPTLQGTHTASCTVLPCAQAHRWAPLDSMLAGQLNSHATPTLPAKSLARTRAPRTH
jgi:hypothetical protein